MCTVKALNFETFQRTFVVKVELGYYAPFAQLLTVIFYSFRRFIRIDRFSGQVLVKNPVQLVILVKNFKIGLKVYIFFLQQHQIQILCGGATFLRPTHELNSCAT
jgi:hypothetical protein